jgi:hypothetical protein
LITWFGLVALAKWPDTALTEPVQKNKEVLVCSIVTRGVGELCVDGRGLWSRFNTRRRDGCLCEDVDVWGIHSDQQQFEVTTVTSYY